MNGKQLVRYISELPPGWISPAVYTKIVDSRYVSDIMFEHNLVMSQAIVEAPN